MSRLRPEKLHVTFSGGYAPEGPVLPRRYTLTHSDRTGNLFLTIGAEFDNRQISGWYTRFMRDEVLAEWLQDDETLSLHVHCHISGGLVLGSSRWRLAIFQEELPLVLEAIRYGDSTLFENQPQLDGAAILVRFHATESQYDLTEEWGTPADYSQGRSITR